MKIRIVNTGKLGLMVKKIDVFFDAECQVVISEYSASLHRTWCHVLTPSKEIAVKLTQAGWSHENFAAKYHCFRRDDVKEGVIEALKRILGEEMEVETVEQDSFVPACASGMR